MDGVPAQAVEANGDPLILARLFGLSFETAIRYRAPLGLLDSTARGGGL